MASVAPKKLSKAKRAEEKSESDSGGPDVGSDVLKAIKNLWSVVQQQKLPGQVGSDGEPVPGHGLPILPDFFSSNPSSSTSSKDSKDPKDSSYAKNVGPPPQPDIASVLSSAIQSALQPSTKETDSLIQSAGNLSGFESMMAPQDAAAYKATQPDVRAGLEGAIKGANTTAEGSPQLQVMQNLLGQMQNRALYYGLPLSQVYGNVTNPFLHALINSPTLQGLSASNQAGSTQIGPNTYSTPAKQPAQGYPASLPQ
jgi:hypothetical protein